MLSNVTAVIHELEGKMKCSVPKEDLLPLLSNQDDIKLKLCVLPPQKRKGKVKAKKRKIEKRISGKVTKGRNALCIHVNRHHSMPIFLCCRWHRGPVWFFERELADRLCYNRFAR